jgi:succinylglutamic semialdehyde dehydrogenase
MMHYINGQWVATGTHRFSSTNPATGEQLWEGWAAGEGEVTAAVEAARKAFPAWAALSVEERYAFLLQFKEKVESQKEELALLIAKETGKVLWDARSEAAAVLGKLGFTMEAYQERTGEKSRSTPVGQAIIRHRPHGVMVIYGPYNFPAHLPNGHIMPSLLAGNTAVFKPSEQTPFVAEWTVKQWEAAGLPAGVLNLVQGEQDTGILLAKARVQGILFTGSSNTGKLIHQQLAGRPEVILALEMGGNNPLIIGDISDVKAAVHETLLSAFTGTGQRCTCARRLIIIESAHSAQFLDMLVTSAKQLIVGAYDAQPEPFMGPVINMREAKRLLDAQEHIIKIGGKALLPMQLKSESLPFITPAILDVTETMNVPDVEYFGPLLQVYRLKNVQEAIAKANETAYGLSAAVFSDSAAQFQQLSDGIRAGLINWNRQTTGASGAGPFGGIGLSGNHRPAGYYSADYSAYPVASVELSQLTLPATLPPGMIID